ncbi:DUF2071 domain-containing protein [Streptomyces sp. HUAS MG91]|uniref:DUF2071 domain-containing protein n=1 Tax=Streptomyces tabacisoli TaxID=3156398 RepID=A0AAU8J469_9ACTN
MDLTPGRWARSPMREVEPVTDTSPRTLPRTLLRQNWRDVIFLHWQVNPFEVAGLLPSGTVPDLHNGRAYAGLVFFRMQGLRFAVGPSWPYVGEFNEVNVRLYSRDAQGRRGVVFLSLDCNRLIPTLLARSVFGLPYHHSHISRHQHPAGSRLIYRSAPRRRSGASYAWIDVEQRPYSPSTLDSFLTNRWGLHESHRNRTYYFPNAHPPWKLLPCTVLGWDATVFSNCGLTRPSTEPISALYSPGLPVRFGMPERMKPFAG